PVAPARRAADFLAWISEDRLDDPYRAPPQAEASDPAIDLMDRLRIYEALQQLHLERERPRVLFDPAVPEIYRSDAADLPRLETALALEGEPGGACDAIVSRGPQGIDYKVH